MTAAQSSLRAAWLLSRLKLRRLGNQVFTVFNTPLNRGRKRAATTTPKSRGRWILSAVAALMMLVGFTTYNVQALGNMQKVLGPDLMHGLMLQLTLLLTTALFITLGNKALAQGDWDLEWLVTLPLTRSALITSRLVERSVTNPTGIIALWPFTTVLAWHFGFRWSAPFIGLVFSMPLFVLLAMLQTLVDTGLRLAWSPARLRNLQAALGLAGALILYVAWSASTSTRSPVFAWAHDVPAWAMWLPTGIIVRALFSPDASSLLLNAAILVAEIVALFAIGSRLLKWQLRNGVVAGGVREAGKRGVDPALAEKLNTQPAGRGWLSAIQRRELRLLSRDRNFLIQTLVLPVAVIGAQYFLRGGSSNFFALGADSPHLAAIAFGLSAYALMFSAFQTLNAEGGALWILYTLPQSIESVLRQKAILWGGITLLYPVAVFGIALGYTHVISAHGVLLMAIVLVGVVIYALMATALGVFGSNPLAQEVQQRVHPTYVYLYLLLSSLYVYAIYAGSLWQRLVVMILTGSLAIALWQKARDELPYLLDPSASPPARVSLADGLIATLLFFVLQSVIALIIIGAVGAAPTGRAVVIGFVIAGAITYGLMRLSYWRAHTTGVPAVFGPGIVRSIGLGLGAGLIAATLAVAYVKVIARLDLLPTQAAPGLPASDPSVRGWLVVLAVVAAPLFEEFIFRGLVFGGLRRITTAFTAAAASAAIFAIVHPPLSALPVFVLGLLAALVYERTKMLLAPMLAHALYNAIVVGFQWNGLQ